MQLGPDRGEWCSAQPQLGGWAGSGRRGLLQRGRCTQPCSDAPLRRRAHLPASWQRARAAVGRPPCRLLSLPAPQQTPARRLPGYGGKAAEAFEQHGISMATDLQRLSQQQMEQLLGLKPAAAAQLHAWCRGLDDTPVQASGTGGHCRVAGTARLHALQCSWEGLARTVQ